MTPLRFRSRTDEIEQVVAHDLFADGAAAVAVRPGSSSSGEGLRVLGFVAKTDVANSDMMRWDGHAVMMAFGPGLTLYAALLQRTG